MKFFQKALVCLCVSTLLGAGVVLASCSPANQASSALAGPSESAETTSSEVLASRTQEASSDAVEGKSSNSAASSEETFPESDPAAKEASTEQMIAAAYTPVLEEYAQAMESSEAPSNPVFVNSEAWAAQQEWVDIPLSFALVDLAQDGTPELLVAYDFGMAGNGSGTSGGLNTYRIYDLYGIQDGEALRLIDSTSLGYRAVLYMYQDGYFCRYGSSGAFDQTEDFYRLSANSASPELLESVHYTQNGKTFTYADGTTQEGSLSDDLRTQSEHFDISLLLEDLDWHFVSEYESVFDVAGTGEGKEDIGNSVSQAGQVLYYSTSLMPDYVQAIGFSGDTFEITGRFAVSEDGNASHSDISDSFETLTLTVMDGTYYYGTGGQAAPLVYTREEIESSISNTAGLGLTLKVQSGVLLELCLKS